MTDSTRSLPGTLLPEQVPAPVHPAAPPRSGLRSIPRILLGWGRALDDAVSEALRPVTLPALRVMLGVLFLWFGLLKVLGRSPVADLVERTLPLPGGLSVLLVLGTAEVMLGIFIISRVLLRLSLFVLVAHLIGTLSTFALVPGLMFNEANVLLLTTEGEFVVKNGALIAGALVLLTHPQSSSHTHPKPDCNHTAGHSTPH